MERDQDQTAPLRTAGARLIAAREAALSAWGPHRLGPVAVVDDVLYVNDSRATFLDAALESLAAMGQGTIWIAGAWGPEMEAGPVQELLRERVAAVVLFGPQAEGDAAGLPAGMHLADSLRTAVFMARELARPGGAVLFSPACPSGNGFANYEERGAEFRRAVKDL